MHTKMVSIFHSFVLAINVLFLFFSELKSTPDTRCFNNKYSLFKIKYLKLVSERNIMNLALTLRKY